MYISSALMQYLPLVGLAVSVTTPGHGQDSTVTLKGTVVNSEGKLVSDVHILLDENRYAAVTDRQRTFVIDNIEPGNYRLAASRVGSERLSRSATYSIPAK